MKVPHEPDLRGSLDVGLPVYVLVDPMVGEPLPSLMSGALDAALVHPARQSAWKRPVYPVPLDARIELPSHLHPYLVALEGLNDPWLDLTLELALSEWQGAWSEGLAGSGTGVLRIAGWINSPLAPQALREALAILMQVHARPAVKQRYLRLGDRRVLDWIGASLGWPRLQAALGRVGRWVYVNSVGGLASVKGAEDDTQPLRVTSAEWAELMRGAQVHPSLARWLACAQGDPAETTPDMDRVDDLLRRVRQVVGRADATARRWPNRFRTGDDFSAWVALCLLHGDVEQLKSVVDLLNQRAEPGEEPDTVHALCDRLHALCKQARDSELKTAKSTAL